MINLRLPKSYIKRFFSLISLSLVITSPLMAQKVPSVKPNIILIYVDDLGYSDIGCYGKEYGATFIETPNIDKFASESIMFTDAYSAAPLCSPSRAALLTGKSPARLNFEFVTKFPSDDFQAGDTAWTNKFKEFPLIPPPYKLNLPLQEVTIAEMLKSFGYKTGIVGKWHVSAHNKIYNGWNEAFGPRSQGFDWAEETFGVWNKKMTNENYLNNKKSFPQDEVTNKAISYIKKEHNSPFFLFVSHYFVHTPLNTALGWLVEKYRLKSEQLGLNYDEKRFRYAAFVETLDFYTGQLLEAVNEAGLKENTLVIFTSDNGGMPEVAFNRPFRGSKWNLYEGGLRVPLLMRYPGVIKENSRSLQTVIQTDFFPTFFELAAGMKYKKKDIDGKSIMPYLNTKSNVDLENRELFWHFPYYHPEGKVGKTRGLQIGVEDGYVSFTEPQSAIRKNNYKLIYYYEDERVELYNLHKDPSEKNDISNNQQKISSQMKHDLLEYLRQVNARFPKRK